MRKNKHDIKEKELRRLYKQYSALWAAPSKKDSNLKYWYGNYEYYFALDEYFTHDYLDCENLLKAATVCTVMHYRHFFLNGVETEDGIRLGTISVKEYNALDFKVQYYFRPIYYDAKGLPVNYIAGYVFKEKFTHYLKTAKRKLYISYKRHQETSEEKELYNHIEKNNLWPKIDRSLGRKRSWYDRNLKKEKKIKILKKELREEIEEIGGDI